MRRCRFMALLAAMAIAMLPAAAAKADKIPFTEDPSAMEQAAASVVKLEVYDSRDVKIGTGTGFCAYSPELLVTAAHVIVNMEYMIATRDDGTTFRIDRAIDGDAASDIALCALPEDAALTPLPVEDGAPMRGEKIAAVGSHFGVANLITLGNVCGRWQAGGVLWILFTAPVSGGCSGGPILNDKGNVIGVITATYDNGQNLNVAAPIAEAERIERTVNGLEGMK